MSKTKESQHRDTHEINNQFTEKDLFLENETQCCLCGNDLHFFHETDYAENKICETAKCSQCHVGLRSREATLH